MVSKITDVSSILTAPATRATASVLRDTTLTHEVVVGHPRPVGAITGGSDAGTVVTQNAESAGLYAL